MRKLKYIKLFEAFDSRVLSKTLGYVNEESKKSFIKLIRYICNTIDFPMSDLSDEYFEYLPFNAALNKNITSEGTPCTAKSSDIFGKYGIEGETCHDGRIKRRWGERTREVACPACGGTGFKPKKSNVELVKFWFTADGEFITTSAVDGVIRPNFSSQVGGAISFDNLEHGEKYLMRLRSITEDFIEGTIYKKNGSVYFIQNVHNGDHPTDAGWRKYGRFSWNISGGRHYIEPILAVSTPDADKVDAYSWNVGLVFNSNSLLSNGKNIKNSIHNANFAIILDYEKLKNKEFQKKSATQVSRKEIKKHSLLDPEQSSENIKKKNIERYIETIIKNTNITDNIANCNKVISRVLTYNSSIYIIVITDIISELQVILRKYLDILDPNSDDDVKKIYAIDINNKIAEISKRNMGISNKIRTNIKKLKELLLENRPPHYDLYIEMIDKIDEISLALNKSIKEYNVKTIEDFEIIFQKTKIAKDIIKSDRYKLSTFFDYFTSYISQGYIDRAYSFLVNENYFYEYRVKYDLERIRLLLTKI